MLDLISGGGSRMCSASVTGWRSTPIWGWSRPAGAGSPTRTWECCCSSEGGIGGIWGPAGPGHAAPPSPGGPGMMVAGGSPAAVRRAARHGLGFIAQTARPELRTYYEEQWRAGRTGPRPVSRTILPHCRFCCRRRRSGVGRARPAPAARRRDGGVLPARRRLGGQHHPGADRRRAALGRRTVSHPDARCGNGFRARGKSYRCTRCAAASTLSWRGDTCRQRWRHISKPRWSTDEQRTPDGSPPSRGRVVDGRGWFGRHRCDPVSAGFGTCWGVGPFTRQSGQRRRRARRGYPDGAGCHQ